MSNGSYEDLKILEIEKLVVEKNPPGWWMGRLFPSKRVFSR